MDRACRVDTARRGWQNTTPLGPGGAIVGVKERWLGGRAAFDPRDGKVWH